MMKKPSRLVWFITILFVGFGLFLLSLPYSEPTLDTLTVLKGTLDLREHNFKLNGPAELAGEIAYFYDDIVYDDEFIEDKMASAFYVDASKPLDRTKFGGVGHGTYFFELKPPISSDLLAIELPVISSAYKLWIDGKLLVMNGRVSSNPELFRPRLLPQRVIFPAEANTVRVLIQVSNYHFAYTGIGKNIIIGTPQQIMQRQVNSHLQEYLIIAIAMLTGAYHIAVYSIRKEEKATLHFGVFSISLGITLIFFGERIIDSIFPNLEWHTIDFAGYIFLTLTVLLMLRYVILLNESKSDTLFEKWIQGIFVGALCIRSLSLDKSYYIWSLIFFMSIGTTIVMYSMVKLAHQMRNNSVRTRVTLVGIYFAMLIFFVHIPEMFSERFSNYGLFLFIFFHALALGFRYSETFSLNLDLTHALKDNSEKLQIKNAELINIKSSLEDLNKQLDNKVDERTEDIKLLLDHSGQAFMSIDSKSEIQTGYSALSEIYLGPSLAGKNFWNVLFPDSPEDVNIFTAAVDRALHESSQIRRESYLSVLPESAETHQRELKIEYKLIHTRFKEQVMVIITDVSFEKSLMEQMEKETRENWTNMKIVLYAQEFWRIYNRVEAFCNLEKAYFEDVALSAEGLQENILKSLHRFKGQLSVYGFNEEIAYIHELEQDIIDLTPLDKSRLKNVVHESSLVERIDERLNKIYENEGVDIYVYRDTVRISKSKLDEIILSTEAAYGEDASNLVKTLYSDNHMPFRRVFEGYADYVVLLGRSVGKEVAPLEITGGEFLVDLGLYDGFMKSVVHILRNMVDHGIEKPELRYERGKPLAGTISVEIEKVGNQIEIKIYDDGGGVDFEALKKNIIRNLGYKEAQISKMDKVQLLELIFSNHVTTKNEGDIVSGRGLGMTLVKEEVLELGGSIRIDSVMYEKTQVEIVLPYQF